MKKLLMLYAAILFVGTAKSQLLSFGANGVTILGGTKLVADSLTLIPSTDITISNNTLSKATTIVHTSLNPYISKVYRLTNTTPAFTGSVQISYRDGAELNGIAESVLTLNIHNGTTWNFYPATTRDATNNFVLTNGVNSTGLNELTLAGSVALPVVWLSFTVTKQNQTGLLKWATAQEQNTRNFSMQHSTNGINWSGIGLLPAAGNSNTTSNYSYIHSNPVTGINYYRILQTDMDNRNSYSDIKTLKFTTAVEPFIIIGNPVTNDVLTVQVNTSNNLSLYTADGKFCAGKCKFSK